MALAGSSLIPATFKGDEVLTTVEGTSGASAPTDDTGANGLIEVLADKGAKDDNDVLWTRGEIGLYWGAAAVEAIIIKIHKTWNKIHLKLYSIDKLFMRCRRKQIYIPQNLQNVAIFYASG